MTITTAIPFEFAAQLEVNPSKGGGFVAHSDRLQVAVIGATEDEALMSFREGVRELIEFCIERNLPLPALLQPV